MGQSSKENFRVIYLNKKYHLIDEYIQEIGTIDQTPFYIREIVICYFLIHSIFFTHGYP
ncbi:JAB domain-containing protein [Wolbachia pipientis]|uniref:JAB domain-containing protein n=1 Tax=Wolbachia pipientis TaxID=955 RepID=UPI0036F2DC90